MPRVEHRFTGPSYTLGIEEELMIVDSETLELVNGIETMLESMPATEGDVKPELMESVLEVSTTPCKDTREASAQLHELRRKVQMTAHEHGLAIGSAGAPPLAVWGGQRDVGRPPPRHPDRA